MAVAVKIGKTTQIIGEWVEALRATVAGHPSAQTWLRPAAIREPDHAILRISALPALTRATDSAPPELALGKTLGQGGMGLVRAARQLSLGREVAVKTLRSTVAGQSVAVRALLHEAMVTGLLEHPNIIKVYALGQDENGGPMLVMKRVEGIAWSDILAQPTHPLRARDARDALQWNLDVLRQVSNAVALAHDRGIVHRDLKPDNVMIGHFGEVYLLDWGVAATWIDDRSGTLPLLADSKGPAGTPCYMAPEQVRGEGHALGPHTDIFLLATLLWEVLGGRAPWTGDDVMEVLFTAFACDFKPLPAPSRRSCLTTRPCTRYCGRPNSRPSTSPANSIACASLTDNGTNPLVLGSACA